MALFAGQLWGQPLWGEPSTIYTPTTLEGSVYNHLLGAVPDVIVYPDHIPESATFPCVSYVLISHIHEHNLDGAAGVAEGLIQFDCWAYEYTDVLDMAEAIEDNLNSYRGILGGGVEVLGVTLDDEREGYEPADNGSDRGVYRVSSDYFLMHRESIPTGLPAYVDGDTAQGARVEIALAKVVRALGLVDLVTPLHRPQSAGFPAITYSSTAKEHIPNLDGASGAVDCRFEVVVYDTTRSNVSSIADQVRLALDGMRGMVNDVYIGACLLEQEATSYVPQGAGNDQGYFTRTLSFRVGYREFLTATVQSQGAFSSAFSPAFG